MHILSTLITFKELREGGRTVASLDTKLLWSGVEAVDVAYTSTIVTKKSCQISFRVCYRKSQNPFWVTTKCHAKSRKCRPSPMLPSMHLCDAQWKKFRSSWMEKIATQVEQRSSAQALQRQWCAVSEKYVRHSRVFGWTLGWSGGLWRVRYQPVERVQTTVLISNVRKTREQIILQIAFPSCARTTKVFCLSSQSNQHACAVPAMWTHRIQFALVGLWRNIVFEMTAEK